MRVIRPGSWHSEDDRERSVKGGAFVWPPRRDAAPPSRGDPISVEPDSFSSAQPAPVPVTPDHLSPVTVWLGQIREPLDRRLARAGLDLSQPSPYCPRCGISVSPAEVAPDDPSSGCHACAATNLAWDRFVRLGEYSGELRRIVLDIKFGRWRELGTQIGQMAGTQLAHRLRGSGLGHLPVVLVPVPMHPVRRVMRGVDHTQAICRGVQLATGARTVSVLRSNSWRTTQLDVVASQREAHARASLATRSWPHPKRFASALSKGGVVVVVDDVKTTGSTLHAACRRVRELIKKQEIKAYRTIQVWGMSLAVTQPGRGSMGEQ